MRIAIDVKEDFLKHIVGIDARVESAQPSLNLDQEVALIQLVEHSETRATLNQAEVFHQARRKCIAQPFGITITFVH